jgi:hypothetical protein
MKMAAENHRWRQLKQRTPKFGHRIDAQGMLARI